MSEGLSLRGLTVVYPGTTAVDAVDLDVADGEVVALLGASGSGKSSLLRAVAGLEDVAAGQVRWAGRDVVSVPVHRRGFGLMFQDGQLFPFRDVGGNVAYGLAGMPRAARAAMVERMLGLVGLPGFEGRAITTLSGGQAQRVALARALAPRPRLLLLDEPLSALDRALREQLAVDVRAILREQGTTALYVTHDQDEAMTVADRIGVMEAGRLARLDTPDGLWSDPRSAYVARFLGFGPLLGRDEVLALGWGEAWASAGTRSGAGRLLALAPGALTACEPGGRPAAPLARVTAVRTRRGERFVDADMGGVVVTARLDQGAPRGVVGEEIALHLDAARTALVR
ncbi:MAG: ABC transporter ATP-binding protein [Actinomyces sp.]|uniref:ABC transporter ATP-binding protein n=1 Tax=Actinomyces sp. TaxID=29317 RepID=UPI0026DBB7F6|nr:ABC transporter ATP-binding protein [Actinomyces sp.]MDO4242879.1 ABC transporter ATP-binding protein [Actinomyces sp.]